MAIDHRNQGRALEGAGGWRERQVGDSQRRQGLADGLMNRAGARRVVVLTAFHRQAIAVPAHMQSVVLTPCLAEEFGDCRGRSQVNGIGRLLSSLDAASSRLPGAGRRMPARH